jgi:hypothetical protein
MTLDTYPLVMDVPVMQRVSNAMFEFGLTPGLKQPYKVANMVQPEPGEITNAPISGRLCQIKHLP